MALRKWAAIGMLILGACAAENAVSVQSRIEAVCAEAMPIAMLYPAVGVYVYGACKNEAAMATLALDPAGLAWLQKVYGMLKAAAGKS